MRNKWSIYLYLNGNNESEPEIYRSLINLSKMSLNSDLNVIIQIGRLRKEMLKKIRKRGLLYLPDENTWSGVRRYLLNKAGFRLLQECGEINLADPRNLTDFLQWGLKNFAAEKNIIIMGGHGIRFIGSMIDYSQELPYMMGIKGMCRAIGKVRGMKVNLLILDICYMNTLELIYELSCQENMRSYLITYIGKGPLQGIPCQRMISIIERYSTTGNIKLIIKRILNEINLDLIAFSLDYNLLKEKPLPEDKVLSSLIVGYRGNDHLNEKLIDFNPYSDYYLKEDEPIIIPQIILSKLLNADLEEGGVCLMNQEFNQLERCCNLGGYEVCFQPTQEVNGDIESNPYYNFVIQRSVWTYTIRVAIGENDLSHWDLAMCFPFLEKVKEQIEDQGMSIADFFQAEVKENGGSYIDITDNLDVLPEGDPAITPINLHDIPVLKIEVTQPADNLVYSYRITIKDSEYFNLLAEPGIVAIKEAGPPGTGFVIFNSYQEYTSPDIPLTCTGDNIILGPSLDCSRFIPSVRGFDLSSI